MKIFTGSTLLSMCKDWMSSTWRQRENYNQYIGDYIEINYEKVLRKT